LEANHNYKDIIILFCGVAYDIAKIYIWKQITTWNHSLEFACAVAYDIAKIYIWKQITTATKSYTFIIKLLMILQRYTFGSKSQLTPQQMTMLLGCL
jgi:hypothetical protein